MSWITTTTGRTVVLSACLVLAAGVLARASKSEPVPLRTPLAQLPLTVDQFEGSRALDLEPDVLAVLGVDDYINRIYRPRGGTVPIGLYIGYYMSQRQGDTMHSPMNCLPGSGWQPIQSGHLKVDVGGQPREINRYIVEKSGDHLLVLYWYQSHGRVVASEYWGRIYMVLDAMRMNRTDAALVRVVVPIPNADKAGEAAAESLAVGFVRTMFPLLDRHLPV